MSQNRVRGHKGKAIKAIPRVQGLGSKGRRGLGKDQKGKAMKARQVGQYQAAASGVKKQAAIPKRVKPVHHRCEVLKTSEARIGGQDRQTGHRVWTGLVGKWICQRVFRHYSQLQ